jgi:hypothetical protein
MHWSRKMWLLVLATLLAVPRILQAHRLDDLLQGALIEITPTEIRLELNQNPGQEIAETLIWMMDRNGDRQITSDELQAYALSFTKQLSLSVDGKALEIQFISAKDASAADLESGNAVIHIELRARVKSLLPGAHELRFENRYLPQSSAYLVNAIAPRVPKIKILKQQRTENQSIGWIGFSIGN